MTPRTRPPRTKSKPRDLQIAVREAVERRRLELRRRYQCDLLQFWCDCSNAPCRRKRACIGDPHACFDRGLAAMPEERKEWLRGAIMATLKEPNGPKGRPGTRQELVRRIDEEIAAARRAKPMNTLELAAWVMRELSAARQAAGLAAGRVAKVEPEAVATPETSLPERATAADEDESDLVEWEPMKGSSIDPIRMAPPPPPPHASPAEADAGTADPPRPRAWVWTGPLNPPPYHCDEQGRLIRPDPADVAEYNKRLKRGISWSEIVARGRV